MYVRGITLTYAGIWLEDQILVYLGRHKTQFEKYLQSQFEQRVMQARVFPLDAWMAAAPEIPTYHSLLLLPTGGLSARNNDFLIYALETSSALYEKQRTVWSDQHENI